jgi:peptidyl-dipeptidase Dcp
LILTTKIKALFPIRKVLNGAFTIKLYGLTFTEVFDIDKYHPEVMTYEVTDDKKRFSGCFYADFFPRKGKRNGAWMTSFKGNILKTTMKDLISQTYVILLSLLKTLFINF